MEDVSKKLNRLMSRIKSKNTQDAIVSPAKMMITPMSIEQPEEFDFAVENRTIVSYIPLVDLVVQFDNNSKILKFKFDRYFDNVDLSQKSVNANFLNAEKNSGHTPCSITSIEENSFIVDWLIESELTTESGKIEYGLEFFEKDATENKIYVWQTKPSSFDIEDSLIILNDTIPTDYTRQRTFYEENNNSTNYLHLKDTGAIIQIDNRTILIGEYSDLAIQQDNLSQILSFKISRYFQNTDLSTKLITIGYVNALGQSDMSTAVNVKLSQLEIEFSWVLDSKVTQKDGSVQFFVSFIGYDEFDKFYLWNTKTATLNIERGLLISDSIEEPEPSWVQSILLDMNLAIQEIKNTAVADMEKETDTVIAETKEAIELTKTATQGALNAVSDLAATALRTSASRWAFHADGNPVVVNPATGSPMKVVADKDCTVWRGGRNWFQYGNVAQVDAVYGSLSYIQNGYSMKINTSPAAQRIQVFLPPWWLPKGRTFTVSCKTNLPILKVSIFTSDELALGSDVTTTSATFITSDKKYHQVLIYPFQQPVGATFSIWDIQINSGPAVKSYAPFIALNSYPLTADTPTEIKAIQGENHLHADNSAWLQVGFNRDGMDLLNTDLTVPVSNTAPVAQIDNVIGGLPLDVTVRAIAAQEGTGDPSPTNVRRIIPAPNPSNLWRGGRNLFDHKIAPASSNVSITQQSNGMRLTPINAGDSKYAIYKLSDALAGKTIAFGCGIIASGANIPQVRVYWGSAETVSIMGTQFITLTATGTQIATTPLKPPDATGLYISFHQTRNADTVAGDYADFTNIMLNLGPTALPYEPYVGHTYPIALSEPLYGLPGAEDEYNAATGMLTRRTNKIVVDETWNLTLSSNQVGEPDRVRFTFDAPGKKFGDFPLLCSHLKTAAPPIGGQNTTNGHSSAININLFMLKTNFPGWDDAWSASQKVSALKSWLASESTAGRPLTFVYQLDTPQTFAFPPVTIPSLHGLNTVYTDAGGDTTVTGRMGLHGFVKRLEALEALTTQP